MNILTKASLRITSTTTSAAEISKMLQIVPTVAYEKGTQASPRNPKSAIRKEAVWILESGLPSTSSVSDHILHLIEIFEKKSPNLRQMGAGFSVDIFCGITSGKEQNSIVLGSTLLRRIGVLPVDIIIDFYAKGI